MPWPVPERHSKFGWSATKGNHPTPQHTREVEQAHAPSGQLPHKRLHGVDHVVPAGVQDELGGEAELLAQRSQVLGILRRVIQRAAHVLAVADAQRHVGAAQWGGLRVHALAKRHGVRLANSCKRDSDEIPFGY
jgi:hypothetical protein